MHNVIVLDHLFLKLVPFILWNQVIWIMHAFSDGKLPLDFCNQVLDLSITEDLAFRIERFPVYTKLQGDSLDNCIEEVQSVLSTNFD